MIQGFTFLLKDYVTVFFLTFFYISSVYLSEMFAHIYWRLKSDKIMQLQMYALSAQIFLKMPKIWVTFMKLHFKWFLNVVWNHTHLFT